MNKIKSFAALIVVLFSMTQAFSYNKQQLYSAVKTNNYAEAKKILTSNSNLATLKSDSEGNSILMVALNNNTSDSMISLLLKAGSSPDFSNKKGETALMLACRNNYSADIIKQIVTFHCITKAGRAKRVLAKDKSGKTSFDYARNNQSLYSALLTFAKDPENPDTPVQPEEPVQETVEQTELAEEIEEPQEELQEIAESPVEEEIISEPVEEAKSVALDVAEESVAEVSEVSADSAAVIASASTVGTLAVAVPLAEEIEKNAEEEPVEETSETTETVEVTEEQTSEEAAQITDSVTVPQIDYYNKNRPEYLFEEVEEISVVEDITDSKPVLIKNPDALDNVGRTRLMNAIMANDLKLCYDLLYSGASVNARDKDGWTPLMFACRYAQTPDIVELLFTYGANIKAKSNFNINVLQITAAFCKNKEILTVVLTHAQEEKLNLIGSFIVALKEARPQDIIRQYLKFIPNINALYSGKTPLMYACDSYESTEVIKLLLENGADPYIISSEKKNAFGYAKANPKLVHDSVYWSLNVSSSKSR